MPVITIDGNQIEVATGTTIIQAAEKLGIYIPRYCYHPGLSIAGSCRMCMVEVEKQSKLQISCHITAAEGMVVRTTNERVKQARQAILEFLLIGHPLDCPVCDQSGECDLQNFYMDYGQYDSRFLENKPKKKKATPIGPTIILDQERCILCSRCTRFTDEITHTHELGLFERGDRSVIDLAPGKVLDNNYSGNVADICPVGALTDRDFRFQCRVWYLRQADSICPGCSRGCNIHVHYNDVKPYASGGRRVLRLKPRFNAEVNRWWMCDVGRYAYKSIDDDRISESMQRTETGLERIEWDEALERVALRLREALEKKGPGSIGVLLSPQLTNEDLYLAGRLFGDHLGVTQMDYETPGEPRFEGDDLLLKADRTPNRTGARMLGVRANGSVSEALLEHARRGELEVLVVFGLDLSHIPDLAEIASKLRELVFVGSNYNATCEVASLILAGAVYAEKEGTFTNFEGRVQKLTQAILPLENALSEMEILVRLSKKLGHPLAFRQPEEVFQELASRVEAFHGLDYERLGPQGATALVKIE